MLIGQVSTILSKVKGLHDTLGASMILQTTRWRTLTKGYLHHAYLPQTHGQKTLRNIQSDLNHLILEIANSHIRGQCRT